MNFIVKEKGEFKVIDSEKQPLNLVLKVPDRTWSNNSYTLVENGVVISWLDYYNDRRWSCMDVTYKKTRLLEINGIRNIQMVIDALLEYKNISDEELERRYQKALKDEKSELELEVEKLREEKKKLTQYHKSLEQIDSKIEELKELLSKIKD